MFTNAGRCGLADVPLCLCLLATGGVGIVNITSSDSYLTIAIVVAFDHLLKAPL